MKYSLYIDESGDHGLSNLNPDFPIFLLCGIIISSKNYQELDSGFNSIKLAIWKSDHVIFHSRDIRKCEKEFKYLFNLDLKEEFYSSLDDIIRNCDYKIIAAAIKKENYIKKYGKRSDDVYEFSLSFVVEHTIFYLETLKDREITLEIIIEKRGSKEDKKLYEHFQKILTGDTGYFKASKISQYNPSISFQNKKENVNGLQLADLIAYPLARHVLEPQRINPAFEVFKDKLYKKSQKGYGLKIYP